MGRLFRRGLDGETTTGRFVFLAALVLRSFEPAAVAQDIPLLALDGAANADGRFEAFAVAADGNLYHRWQAPDLRWLDWQVNAAGQYSQVRVARSVDARLYVFGLDGGALVIRAQSTPNGGWLAESVRRGWDLRSVAVTLGNDGRFVVVAIGGDGSLWAMHGRGDQGLVEEDWSQWQSVGGSQLRRVAVERDGDGRVVAAALDADGQVWVVSQSAALTSSTWEGWHALEDTGLADLVLARDRNRTLWLLEAGAQQGIFGRALAATVPAQPEDPRALVPGPDLPPPPTRNPRFYTPAPAEDAPGAANPRTQVPGTRWSDRVTLLDRPLSPFRDLTVSTARDGWIDLFAAGADLASEDRRHKVVRLGQDESGAWSATSQPLGFPLTVDLFAGTSSATGRGGAEAVFALDQPQPRAWVVARKDDENWSEREWFRLGRIPGPGDPDLTFQALACLEFVSGTGADALRRQILEVVPGEVTDALNGTTVGSLATNVSTVAQCVGQHEVIALWLDHEVWKPALAAIDILPSTADPSFLDTFAVVIPLPTIEKVFAKVWEELPKRLDFEGNPDDDGAIELTGYEVNLQAPSGFELRIAGKALSVPFDVVATAQLGVREERPDCQARLRIDSPDDGIRWVAFLATGFFFSGPTTFIADKLAATEARLSGQAAMACKLSEALMSKLYLPVNKDRASAQVMEILYDRVEVLDEIGVRGSGSRLPVVRPRQPRVQMSRLVHYPTVGASSVDVSFYLELFDLKPPLKSIEWIASDGEPVRLLTPADVKRAWQTATYADFQYAIAPSDVPRLYSVGRMTVRVTDADDFVATAGVNVTFWNKAN